MNYSAISIQGNILTSEILEKIRTEDIRFQKAADFNLNPGASVRDEINLAWSLAVSNWNVFKIKRDALSDSDSGTSETRRYWMLPLLSVLGYEINSSNAEIINEKSYAISHRASNKDAFPLHLVGVQQSLDKRPETGGTRLSPHALMQEYLNNTEHLYGLVSNGRFLRLLRDATRLSRLSYLEFDLEQMMEEGLYVEFALLYRTLHASRMPERMDAGPDSNIEFYHQEAIASGSRIRERLSVAVESSIRELANGLLLHPQNETLRRWVLENKIEPNEYYLHTLRLVYRMLFLLVIEERKLIYADKRDEELNKKRSIYYDYYSIQRLTKLAVKMTYIDPRKTDLWHSLLTTFSLFEYDTYGKKLGIAPLGSGLFAPSALGIVNDQMLDNDCLLRVIRYLVTFVNENGQLVRVNYADLDVEEFGSIYEGLLEYQPVFTDNMGQPIFSFVKGNERSKSGSHYTPEELVKPLITHSLDYLIADKLKTANPEAELLSLKICDVACGSGHILLSAARRVGFELAKYRSKEDQPTPTAMRAATRDVIRNCIYGVDLNPLAVELCKVALWLEAHQPGEPLNFLDHHIKCGDAIVGLAHRSELENGIADEAFKTLPGDDKTLAKALRDQNVRERKARNSEGQQVKADFEKTTNDSVHEAMAEYKTFMQQPETTPDEIERKARAYRKFIDGKGYGFLKAMADTQVAQFFIPKTEKNKDQLLTDAEYRLILTGHQGWQDRRIAMAAAVSQQKHFFHWFLEFPEVFQGAVTEQGRSGGFDCILGNPPFLGGTKISSNYGSLYQNFIAVNNSESGGLSDLVSYFFRRAYLIVGKDRFLSLISTNSISQGDTRKTSLEFFIKNGSSINHASPNIKWPGVAAVEVSLISVYKGLYNGKTILRNKNVDFISSFLDDVITISEPRKLNSNIAKSYVGSSINAIGFVIENSEAESLLKSNIKNIEIVLPFLSGYDINESPNQQPSRSIINFFDWPLSKAIKYVDCMKIVEDRVKPQRLAENSGNSTAIDVAKRWWQFKRPTIELYRNVKQAELVLCCARVSKYTYPVFVPTNYVYMDKIIVYPFSNNILFLNLCSTIYEQWVWKYSSTLGSSTVNNSPTECFETFPFAQNLTASQEQKLEQIGEAYHEHRRQLMLKMQLGLTKTYNAFHAKEIQESRVKNQDLEGLDKKTIEKKYGKEVWNLWNHLQKHEDVCTLEEAIVGIIELRRLHVLMDEAVLEAYSWTDVSLRHDFYEVDYLPENDRVRYTIHPEARKEILKRLLELNHKIHAEEVEAGLWEKKKTTAKKKESKSKPYETKVDLSVLSEPRIEFE
jgi:hypothetical protein